MARQTHDVVGDLFRRLFIYFNRFSMKSKQNEN